MYKMGTYNGCDYMVDEHGDCFTTDGKGGLFIENGDIITMAIL